MASPLSILRTFVLYLVRLDDLAECRLKLEEGLPI